MLNETTTSTLRKSLLFQGLTQNEQQIVLENGHIHRVESGDYFFHQGEEASTLYTITEGHVKLTQVTTEGEQVIINYFGPGDGLGIIVALIGIPYLVSAEAVELCTAVSWHRDTMKQLMLRYPQLAFNGMELIGKRFAWLQTRYQEIATRRVEQRVARALLRLIRQFGKQVDEGIILDMPLSREDLAQMTGTNLYNVSRILSKWEQQGFLSTKRKHITLLQPHQVVAIAEDIHIKKN